MIKPEQLAEAIQNVRFGENYLPANNKLWAYMDDDDKEVLVCIARAVLHQIERPRLNECTCQADLKRFALDLKCVLEKYCS
jgi:hypothetical protein